MFVNGGNSGTTRKIWKLVKLTKFNLKFSATRTKMCLKVMFYKDWKSVFDHKE